MSSWKGFEEARAILGLPQSDESDRARYIDQLVRDCRADGPAYWTAVSRLAHALADMDPAELARLDHARLAKADRWPSELPVPGAAVES